MGKILGEENPVQTNKKWSRWWNDLRRRFEISLLSLNAFVLLLWSREMHEGAVLLNLRKRSERELIYVSI